ncbi:MAG: hypothetical protein CMJ49_04475 [Planctomycetaceae bacterium]|nr:hypothetical protein [Planctomycetaceae bacterium]
MTVTQTTSRTDGAAGRLAERCATMGVAVFYVDLDGHITQIAGRGQPDQWLSGSPLLHDAVIRSVPQWNEQDDPGPQQAWLGCWVVPLLVAQRRRRLGYQVAVILTKDLPNSEQFVRMCDAAQLDRTVIETRIRSRLWPAAHVSRFAESLRWLSQDADQLDQRDREITSLSNQLSGTYEELSLLYKISTNMTVTQDPSTFLGDACTEIRQVLGLSWLALQLTDQDVRLGELRGRLISSEESGGKPRHIPTAGAAMLDFVAQQPDPNILAGTELSAVEGLRTIGRQVMVVPLTSSRGPIGVMFGADKVDGTDLSSVDEKLATSLCQNIRIFLENAMLYEDMQDMFMGTLRALVSSIDAKDAYTRGHSERVAWMGRQLAEAGGLDAKTVERIYLSGLVHDVGKIGVPEVVLCKPGKLTVEEYEIIKTHPEIGGQILDDIRQMEDLIPGVLHHHERWDGRGYPFGLEGRDISLFGRILCLADSFDAMSSTRTYRAAMPLSDVLDEVRRCTGTQFDPDWVDPFMTLDFDHYQAMVKEHQQRESPLDQALGHTR